MTGRPTLADALACAFALAERGRFSGDPALLHGAIYVAREACPELDGFDWSPLPAPRSALLAIVIALLKAYGTLEEEDRGGLVMTERARQRVRRDVLPRFSEEGRARLARAAAILDAVCGIATDERTRTERG
jgi:hypothetical protein